jgi:hypothetical protein
MSCHLFLVHRPIQIHWRSDLLSNMSNGQYQLSGHAEGVMWAAVLIRRIVTIHIPGSNTS